MVVAYHYVYFPYTRFVENKPEEVENIFVRICHHCMEMSFKEMIWFLLKCLFNQTATFCSSIRYYRHFEMPLNSFSFLKTGIDVYRPFRKHFIS